MLAEGERLQCLKIKKILEKEKETNGELGKVQVQVKEHVKLKLTHGMMKMYMQKYAEVSKSQLKFIKGKYM